MKLTKIVGKRLDHMVMLALRIVETGDSLNQIIPNRFTTLTK